MAGLDLTGHDRWVVVAVSTEESGHQDRVGLGAVNKALCDAGEAGDVLLAAAGEVDRVRRRRGRGQLTGYSCGQLGREFLDVQACLFEAVAGQGGVPTAVGEDRDP